MKLTSLALVACMSLGAVTLSPPLAAQSYSTAQNSHYSDSELAELDSLLAPVALYPDTVLTHVLIAATAPLDVVAADRWQQQNSQLSPTAIEAEVAQYDWDPSVKALLLFSDVLHTMASDLRWLDNLGQHVTASQSQVLARVQVLRDQAMNAGNLRSNSYQQVSRSDSTVIILPVSAHTVHLPYYDTRVVYGHWQHHYQPVYWHRPAHYRQAGSLYWSPGIHFSAVFDFGAIHWRNLYVVVNRLPIKRYRYHSPVKRVSSRDFQRWQPTTRVVHTKRVVRSTPAPVGKISHTRQVDRQVIKHSSRTDQRTVKSTITRQSDKPLNRAAPEKLRQANAHQYRVSPSAYGERRPTTTRQRAHRQAPASSRGPTGQHRDGRTINR